MMFRHLLGCMLLSVPAVLAAATSTNFEKSRPDEASRWADSVYSTLTERQRVAQLVFPTVNPTDGDASKAVVRRFVATDACGGLLFSGGTFAQYASMISYAQSLAKVPLLITYDGEWGLNMRIKDAPRFPKNMALGAITDYKLIYEYGREMARECRLLGVNVNFAPDADVNSNPSNPVIGQRSFGEDPARVAMASTAYSLGLEDGGVQAVAKHFPGHGDTDVDSHKALPTVGHSRATLDATDLVPFKDFIGAGCSGIMVGHISVPALDATGAPASLSKAVSTDLLRGELGFDGLVYTDALAMRGAVDPKGRNTSLAALMAGADVLLNPTQPAKAIDAIMAAIADGTVSKDEIAVRCKRILRYKYLLGAGLRPAGTAAAVKGAVCSPEADALIKRLAAASITVVKNEGAILPLDPAKAARVAVVNIGAKSGNDFMNTCGLYTEVEPHYTMGEDFSAASIAKINGNDIIIAAVYDDKAATRAAFAHLVKDARKPVVAVFFITPYRMAKFAASIPALKGLVLAYEDIAAERVSAAEALFGGIAVSGRLPVNLPGIAPVGTGFDYPKTALGYSSPVAEGFAPWLADSIDTAVGKALAAGAFPGCQVLVAKGGNIVYDKCFGRLSSAKESAKVNHQTAYDLASVSKATGTLAGIMKAYDSGLLRLDASLGELIPELTDTAKRALTVRELLYHRTGMPPSLNMFTTMIDTASYTGKLITPRPDKTHSIKIQRRAYGHSSARLRTDILGKERSEAFPVEAAKGIFTGRATYDTIMARIYNIPLKSKTYRYSCLNFCLLMDIEQRLTGRPHDVYVAEEIFEPLGAYRTAYRPRTNIGASNVAPTEHDTFLRRQTLAGYVHDELAAFSGGVQGNAGLFANARDVAKYCQMLLNGGTYGGKRLLSEATAKLFSTDKSPDCRRGLGFDKPDVENPDNSPTCEEASAAVFGHLGFTGTAFWVDPDRDLIFVFLTNRVNPTRDNAAFNKHNIRPHLFSIINRALI
ncbi:MAG: serine hydrolase [Muribaculaceae bacterium]|nr:serine hydrolase [Muribaculaceae bacterium]